MIALDTNVLARYILQDDPDQSAAATALIEAQCTPEHPGLVSSVVLCELAWVLSRGYRISRTDLARTFRTLFTAKELELINGEIAWQALRYFERGTADFADYLLGTEYQAQGAATTFTFDRAAADCDLFTRVPAAPREETE